MNQRSENLLGMAQFLARHGLALAACLGIASVLVALGLLLTLAAYVVLFLIAVVSGSGLGGILALPAILGAGMVAWLACFAAVLILILPAVVMAEGVCQPLRGSWRYLGQMVASTLLMGAGCTVVSLALGWLSGSPQAPILLWLALLIPLGAYWWIAKAVELAGGLIATPFLRRS